MDKTKTEVQLNPDLWPKEGPEMDEAEAKAFEWLARTLNVELCCSLQCIAAGKHHVVDPKRPAEIWLEFEPYTDSEWIGPLLLKLREVCAEAEIGFIIQYMNHQFMEEPQWAVYKTDGGGFDLEHDNIQTALILAIAEAQK